MTQQIPRTAETEGMHESEEPTFAFEKLDVYRCPVEFVATAARIISELPYRYSSLADQLRRAALSVPVNIAEGVGRTSVVDRRHH